MYDLRISRPLGPTGRITGLQDNETGKIIELDVDVDGDFGGCIVTALAFTNASNNTAGVGEVIIYGANESTGFVPVARAFVTDQKSWRLVAMLSGLPFTRYRFDAFVANGTIQVAIAPTGPSSSTGIFVDKSAQQPPAGWTTPSDEPTGEFANLTQPARWDDPPSNLDRKLVRTVAGVVWELAGANNGGADRWIQIFDAIAFPANGVVPLESLPVPAGEPFFRSFTRARALRLGLVWAVSSTSDTYTRDAQAIFWVNTEHGI